ncbi:MAG: 4Fe-4S binding protein [Desulfurococcaceae archaeon]
MVRVVSPQENAKLPISKPVIGVAGKTGLWRVLKPVVNLEKCTRCFQCEIYCPVNVIRVEPELGVTIDYEHCKGCGICEGVCPNRAIVMTPESGD